MQAAIETFELTKAFGSITAVDGVNLRVERGTIFGFIGPNGAGKSTTIRMLIDAIRPSHGSAQILGLDCHRDMIEVHSRTGYLPAELPMPGDLDGNGYLDFLSALRGVTDRGHRDVLVDRFDLDPTRKLRELSTGNKRKIALVQTFMHRPQVVLLDEPTSGIDPLIQHEFHAFLAEFAAAGGSAFLSSHTLSEVERVADRVAIIRQGRIVKVDAIAELLAQAERQIEVTFATLDDLGAVASQLRTMPDVRNVDVGPKSLTIVHSGDVDSILRTAVAAGTVASVRAAAVNLEEVFLDYYQPERVNP